VQDLRKLKKGKEKGVMISGGGEREDGCTYQYEWNFPKGREGGFLGGERKDYSRAAMDRRHPFTIGGGNQTPKITEGNLRGKQVLGGRGVHGGEKEGQLRIDSHLARQSGPQKHGKKKKPPKMEVLRLISAEEGGKSL